MNIKVTVLTLFSSLLFNTLVFGESPKVADKDMIKIAELYNEKSSDLQSVIDLIAKTDSKKADELRSTFSDENIPLKTKMPRITYSASQFSFKIEDKTFYVKPASNGTMIVSLDGKEVSIKSGMILLEMKEAMGKLLNAESFSLIQLLIPNANANPLLTGAILTLGAMTVYAINYLANKYYAIPYHERKKVMKQVASIKEKCEQSQGKTLSPKEIADIRSSIKIVSNVKIEKNFFFNGDEDDRKLWQQTLTCLTTLESNARSNVDNTSRSNKKEDSTPTPESYNNARPATQTK